MKKQIKATIEKYGLTVESVFIPFSRSRNKGEKSPSLNWTVTLKQNGRAILSTDYSAGCGHAPSYRQNDKSYDTAQAVKTECEKGLAVYGSMMLLNAKKPIKPDAADVIYSLLIDSEVIDYPSFEDWAGEFGYDADSRSAEQTYNECMKIALKFRQLGESAISELREVYQDY
jgi:hypothetical protein